MKEWKIPSPHQVLGFVVVLVYTMMQSGVFPEGSKSKTICETIVMVAGLLGIGSAAKFLPPNVKKKLEERDDEVEEALAMAAKKKRAPRIKLESTADKKTIEPADDKK